MISRQSARAFQRTPLGFSSLRPQRPQVHLPDQHSRRIWLEAAASSAQLFQHAHHSLGLEWYLAIPAVAAVFNFAIRFPLSMYTTMQRARRRKLEPLVTAWRDVHMFDVYSTAMQESAAAGRSQRPEDVRKLIETRARELVTKEARRINKLWGVQNWKSVVASLASLPPYMVFVGALSALSGTDRGWVKMVLPSEQWVDPSLATGGLLWFQNLAEADPVGVLPIATMVLFWIRTLMVVGREHSATALGNGDKKNMASFSVTVIRLQYLYPVVFAIMGNWIPAGGMLFIMSSTIISMVNQPLAQRLLRSRIARLHTIKGPPSARPPIRHISGSSEPK